MASRGCWIARVAACSLHASMVTMSDQGRLHCPIEMVPKEMLAKALFSSDRHDWETPAELFNELDAEFGFEIGVCATTENTKCPHFFSPEQDGLKQSWRGTRWMNPPYGSALPRWMAKVYTAS